MFGMLDSVFIVFSVEVIFSVCLVKCVVRFLGIGGCGLVGWCVR